MRNGIAPRRPVLMVALTGLILGAVLIGAMFPATAQAEVSPEKQAALNAHGWTVGGEMTVTPLPTEAAGDRECKRIRSRTAIRDYDKTAMVQDWASVGACITRSGQLRVIGVGHGQGSSGDRWKRVSPWDYPWIKAGWVDRPRSFKSRTEVIFRYGNGQANYWNLAAYARATIHDNRIVGKREGSVR